MSHYQDAYQMLSAEARSKISVTDFINTKKDFGLIINLFQKAGIATRNFTEISGVYVFHLGDNGGVNYGAAESKTGYIRLVMVNENGTWKIANVLEDCWKGTEMIACQDIKS